MRDGTLKGNVTSGKENGTNELRENVSLMHVFHTGCLHRASLLQCLFRGRELMSMCVMVGRVRLINKSYHAGD